MAPPAGYEKAPPSVVTDFDAESTVYANSLGSPSLGSGSKETTPTSVTSSHAPQDPGSSSTSASRSFSGSPSGEPTAGWPSLACGIAKSHCYEAYPRFRELNVKNLLYYQAELAKLESDLRDVERKDHRERSDKRDQYAIYAVKMLDPYSKDPNNEDTIPDVRNPNAKTQRQLVYKIRRLLKEYNEALLQHAQITALPHPNYHNIESLRVKLQEGKDFGENGIWGAGNSAWGDISMPPKEHKIGDDALHLLKNFFVKQDLDKDERDLVTVHQHQKLDGFTGWVKQDWIPFYHFHLRSRFRSLLCVRKKEEENIRTVGYKESNMLRFTSAVAMIIACILPTVAIGILTTAQTTKQKLLYIGGFTALFTIGLMWLTDTSTSRVSIFTATAAFSAVLVVFVQGQ